MGCNFCYKGSSSQSSSPSSSSSKFNNIRLVHFNGYIEYLDQPVTVSELIGKTGKELIFTHAQFLSSCSTPLKLDENLEMGRVYFVLPYSLFAYNASPLDLAPIVRKLAHVAKSNRSVSVPRFGERKSTEREELLYGMRRQKSTWKPVLDPIGEVSFTQRSTTSTSDQSDLSR